MSMQGSYVFNNFTAGCSCSCCIEIKSFRLSIATKKQKQTTLKLNHKWCNDSTLFTLTDKSSTVVYDIEDVYNNSSLYIRPCLAKSAQNRSCNIRVLSRQLTENKVEVCSVLPTDIAYFLTNVKLFLKNTRPLYELN